MRFMILAAAAVLIPATVQAADDVSLTSKVLVERQETRADGSKHTVLEEPKLVAPGDAVVFQLNYRNQGAEPATGFVLTNPIPKEVVFAGAGDAAAIMSVDGGKTWGPLASLKVAGPDGKLRPATAADVTHVRWSFVKAIPSGTGGQVSFKGTVR